VQTFLPYADFITSASVLDRERLGKQRVETLQILHALTIGSGWVHHPVTKMWSGYESALVQYGFVICDEWISRGYKDTVREKLESILSSLPSQDVVLPPWLGDIELHQSHRSNLLRKDPAFYSQYGWTEPNDLEYKWILPA
jgi:hypothetical protein